VKLQQHQKIEKSIVRQERACHSLVVIIIRSMMHRPKSINSFPSGIN